MNDHLTVHLAARTYNIWIGPDMLERAGELIPLAKHEGERAALVTDAHVAGLHAERARVGLKELEIPLEEFTIEPGESSKSITVAESLWRWLTQVDMHRGDPLVAFGGGVVGDVAGFVAATYHRGIPFVQMPTTLLGMVDSAIGGKTAIDLPEGKNLVGAFHQPRVVVADTSTLATLPDVAFSTGMAEVIKHALIAPGDLLERLHKERDKILAREITTLTQLVYDAAKVKVAIVEEDERESAARAYLNYGHTLAHALESLGGYTRWTHGQAVGIGLMFAANLAVQMGLPDHIDEHRRALEAFDLPTNGAGFAFEEVAKAMTRDKKYQAGMRFVVLEDLGKPLLEHGIAEEAVRAAYEAVR